MRRAVVAALCLATPAAAQDAAPVEHGRSLVEVAAAYGNCHTPMLPDGQLDRARLGAGGMEFRGPWGVSVAQHHPACERAWRLDGCGDLPGRDGGCLEHRPSARAADGVLGLSRHEPAGSGGPGRRSAAHAAAAVTIRGQLTLEVAGRAVTITGGPFDAIPEGAFGVCLEPEAAKAWLADVALPIPDFGVPQMADLKRAVGLVLAQLEADPARPVHVGCRAGIGRTGLFLACLARATGVADDPIGFVRARYHRDAAETPDQERMARDFIWP